MTHPDLSALAALACEAHRRGLRLAFARLHHAWRTGVEQSSGPGGGDVGNGAQDKTQAESLSCSQGTFPPPAPGSYPHYVAKCLAAENIPPMSGRWVPHGVPGRSRQGQSLEHAGLLVGGSSPQGGAIEAMVGRGVGIVRQLRYAALLVRVLARRE